jgi:cyclic pyranopterin phosphate synthase
MVDTTEKSPTSRLARASARVVMHPETLALIRDRKIAKGDVFEVARLAGIMAAKRTSDLIPLCHPLSLTGIALQFVIPDARTVEIEAVVKVHARTGVEMEALVAVSTAALTIYDMCKSMDRGMVIEAIQLEEKRGGKSGVFRRKQDEQAEDTGSRGTGPDFDTTERNSL